MWSQTNLLEKARLYFQRGASHAAPEEAELQAFWYVLGIEFLARAALSSVSPALIAEGGVNHLLHAYGYGPLKKEGKTYRPRQINLEDVVLRCEHLFAGTFAGSDKDWCMAAVDKRNSEMHSGLRPFEGWPKQDWQPEFFRACRALCAAQGLDLGDVFPQAEAEAGAGMLQELGEETRNKVAELIAEASERYKGLDDDEKRRRLEFKTLGVVIDQTDLTEDRDCPACGNRSVLTARLRKEFLEAGDNGVVIRRKVYLPVRLRCRHCELSLAGLDQLRAAGGGIAGEIERQDTPRYEGAPGPDWMLTGAPPPAGVYPNLVYPNQVYGISEEDDEEGIQCANCGTMNSQLRRVCKECSTDMPGYA